MQIMCIVHSDHDVSSAFQDNSVTLYRFNNHVSSTPDVKTNDQETFRLQSSTSKAGTISSRILKELALLPGVLRRQLPSASAVTPYSPENFLQSFPDRSLDSSFVDTVCTKDELSACSKLERRCKRHLTGEFNDAYSSVSNAATASKPPQVQDLTYCVRVTNEEYQAQSQELTDQALVALMNSILDDTRLPLKEKQKHLKHFMKQYPRLGHEYFADLE